MAATTSDALPYLTFELAREIAEFPAYVLDADSQAVAEYRSITGDDNPLYDEFLPPGFAGIFGRDAYLREHRMPPGGVLLAQDITWLAPARRDRDVLLQARLVSAEDDGRKRILIFETTGRQDDQVVVRVRITARWPS